MEFRILGPLEVIDDTTSLPLAAGKQRALLADLLLSANRTVTTARLVDDLWGESAPSTASKMVQIYVSRLRKTLPDGRLDTRGAGYAVRVEPAELDLARVQHLLSEARGVAAARPDQASAKLREALELWRGPALAEFGEPFAQVEGPRLEELRLAALEAWVDAELALGRHAELVGELDALVGRHPLRERLRGQQMLALYRSGRQADALAAYAAYRTTLDDELGIAPSAALRELERAILNQDPALEAAPPRSAVHVAAGKDEPVAPPLAGREREAAELSAAYEEALAGRCRLVLVTGEPGAGKTALVDDFLASEARRRGALVARRRTSRTSVVARWARPDSACSASSARRSSPSPSCARSSSSSRTSTGAIPRRSTPSSTWHAVSSLRASSSSARPRAGSRVRRSSTRSSPSCASAASA